ncbi:MAG: stage V sporulation protein AD [Chloroflexota bacterium]
MKKRMGRQTVMFRDPPVIIGSATIVGPHEGKGPLRDAFDVVKGDQLLGQKSWEQAESQMLQEAALLALKKAALEPKDADFLLAGDLLNQIISANFAARELSLPFIGLYGACSTMALSLALGSLLVDGGYASRAVCAVSSHFDTAERQYRYPTEFGAQRVPTSQRTVTGAGAAILAEGGSQPGPVVTHATFGSVVDLGVKDPNDMGSAMAPAAVQTLWQHLEDTGRTVEDYDLILTGDLGKIGKDLCIKLAGRSHVDLSDGYEDCGCLIYDMEEQDVHAGGSGCACSAVVFLGHILPQIRAGRYRRILLIATGALFSPTTQQQGETIPCIAHAIAVEGGGGDSR